MEAFSRTQAGRSVGLFSDSQALSVSSFKGRQCNVKCSVSPRNGGGSVAETSPSLRLNSRSPLRLFWFVKGGKENSSGKESEDSNVSLLNGASDLNLRESLQEKSQIEAEAESSEQRVDDSDDRDGEEFSFRDQDANGYFDESDENDGEQGRSSGARENWVGRILEMRSFWKDKDKCKSAAVMEPLKKQAASSSSSRDFDCSEEGDGDGCGCCYTEDRSVGSPMLEVPRTEVKHDRNSFSRFLHRVSLSEIKFFAQLSHLCNLAYTIPDIKGLEVLVHRGIYEAAKGIYEQILPEVYAHLQTHGEDARFRFIGHSLGGSLSVLINLMLLIREVVPLSSLLPVITFGSPCIMCGGDYLLKKLGLSTSHIQSVMMHRDIVPRAFSCHYPDHVAEILKRLNANFRNHPCLDNLGLLYAPMGQLLILQPDDTVSPPHHLLPSGSGLYILRHILNNESDGELSREVQLRAAQIAFLNSPHPLETLSDPHAYGFDGSVLRDHDSRNYRRTLQYVLNQEMKHRRRLLREQRRQMWWPLVVAESSILVQRSSKASITMRSGNTYVGAVSTLNSIPCSEAPRKFGFPFRVGIIFSRSKDTLRRFARLIASQHMQMGVLFLVSARMLIVEVCTKIYS